MNRLLKDDVGPAREKLLVSTSTKVKSLDTCNEHRSPHASPTNELTRHSTPPYLKAEAPTVEPAGGKTQHRGLPLATTPHSHQSPPPSPSTSNCESSRPSRRSHLQHQRSYEQAIASAAGGGAVPPDMRCRYKTGRCPLARAMKRSGRPLLLCEFHRAKQNSIKRKSDTKYRTDRLAQKKPPSPIAATAPATIVPLDFYSHSFTEQLGLPLGLPLGLHYDNSPTIMSMTPPPDEMIVSPTSDMGGEDIALLQFFMLH